MRCCIILLFSAMLAAPALAGGYGGYYYGGHYDHGYHGDGDEGAALLAGLVIGGLMGYLISQDRYYRRAPGWRHPHAIHGYEDIHYRHEVYRHGAPRRYARIVSRPAASVTAGDPELAGRGCRMTREYTTTLEIDGRAREAYGTKCLTVDGTWVLGRPKLVPRFE